MFTIKQACWPEDVSTLLDIWKEYVATPSVSLSYQNYETEFANLPWQYEEPNGCVLLAHDCKSVVGCIAFRRINSDICEMKRLYVRPHAQGHGLGRKLVGSLLQSAKLANYKEMRLDVLAEFKHAKKLYFDLGFVPAEPVSHNPIPGTQFLGLKLN